MERARNLNPLLRVGKFVWKFRDSFDYVRLRQGWLFMMRIHSHFLKLHFQLCFREINENFPIPGEKLTKS